MPKKAYLANHLNSDERKQKYLKSQDGVESRRWHLLWKVSLNWTLKNSAIAVGINYDYAKKILKKYNELGAEGVKNLKNQHHGSKRGNKSLLSDEQLEKLAKELESRPADGGIWTGPKVARWIEIDAAISEKKRSS
ncbi:MAG: helix-turn-helix domain-containing protein [Nostoc sp.]|uniref:helix-turn-helix domain-containing protein n=1 Tax=Nostoc sp. TaxID=1180 RepID=UPI002FFCE3AA